MQLFRRLWYLVRSRRLERDLEDEIALHRALIEEDLARRGGDAAEVAASARRTLGNTALAADEARDAILAPWLRDVAKDVRFAGRMLAKDRRFTAAAVFALGLGIGVNNSVFALINAALIRDLPFAHAERLVGIDVIDRAGRTLAFSYDEYAAWNGAITTLTGIGVSAQGVMNVSDEGLAPERLRGSFLSGNAFALLQSGPLLGRGFLPEDERPGAPPIVLLGHGVWKSRYGADPAVVGRTIRINNLPTTVIGVMPEGFKFPFVAEAWQPLTASPEVAASRARGRVLRGAFGRLAEGVDLPRAQLELEAVAARTAQAFPDRPAATRVVVSPLKDGYTRGAKAPLLTFMGAVGFVLLIACANVANLLLARAASRSREMAIRASLGASRWRLVRQLLIECLVLALLAGAVGMLLSRYGARALAVAFNPIEPGVAAGDLTPFWLDLSLDGSGLTFIGMACLFATLAFGLVPALQVARVDVNGVLKDGERGGGHRGRRWTSSFIIAEVALTLVLLTGAGLLWRSFYVLYTRELVIETEKVVSMRLTLPAAKYDTADKRRLFLSRLETTLDGLPALSSTTLVSHAPFAFGTPLRSLTSDAVTASAPSEQPPSVGYVYAGRRYFETLGLRLTHGRLFNDTSPGAGADEAIVDRQFVAMYFPKRDPIGHRIRLDRLPTPGPPNPSPAPGRWLTIVGVAPTIPPARPGRPGDPLVYVSSQTEPEPAATVVILGRSDHGLAATMAVLRDRVRGLDPDLPLYAGETLDTSVAQARAPQRLLGRWFGAIASIALLLAAVGIWGVTAHGVAQRTHEIGVRIALGARPSQVTWLFLRRTSVLLATGLALGLAAALITGRLLRAFLIQIDAADPLTLAAVVGLLAAVALTASLVPARRAARPDPVTALRRE
jgi:putative ABC transport system permease protein